MRDVRMRTKASVERNVFCLIDVFSIGVSMFSGASRVVWKPSPGSQAGRETQDRLLTNVTIRIAAPKQHGAKAPTSPPHCPIRQAIHVDRPCRTDPFNIQFFG